MQPALLLLPWILSIPAPAFAQESEAILDAPLVVVSSASVLDHLLDWNGDGWMDFVVYDGGHRLTGVLNDRQGGFRQIAPALGSGERGHLETCDANQDGRDDLVWVSPSFGFSTTTPSLKVVAIPDLTVEHFPHLDFIGPIDFGTILDADADGDADRVRIYRRVLTLELYERDATGSWVVTASSMQLGFLPQTLVRMDYDGDAYPDLYLQHGGLGTFVPLREGRLQTPVTIHQGVDSPMPMALPGDVDGDGDQDLALFDMDHHRIYRRVGPASWSLEPLRLGGPAAKLADVDGDGDLDGVCCSSGGGGGGSPDHFDEPSTFRIALNDGTGAFAPAFTIPGLGSKEIAGAADLDHDGDVDLVAGQCIYYARGPLDHPPQRALPSPPPPRSLFDFDRDGDADFGPGLGTFARHRGDGSTYAFSLRCPAPPAGSTDEGPGLPGDWDGDGDVDLLVRRLQGGGFLEMRLLVNEGGGSYADGGSASALDFLPGVARVGPESSFAVDLDLDGDLDLVTYHRWVFPDPWTRTWLNDGRGLFTLAWMRAGTWPLGFGELRAGGPPDALLVGRYGGASLHVGTGDGRLFQPESAWHLFSNVGPLPDSFSVALADFDVDGDVDLVGDGYFFPNLGGNLSPLDKVFLDDVRVSASRFADAGDVDGDGLVDVVLSSSVWRPTAISIVRRKPDNSGWLLPVRQVVHPAEGDAAVVVPGAVLDLDGDGDSEYVNGSIWSNALRSAEQWGTRRQDASGIADSGGRVPTLGASGPFRPGERARLRLTGAPPGAPGVLSVERAWNRWTWQTSDRFTPLLSFVTRGPDRPGAGRWTLPYRVSLALAGLEVCVRVDLVDPRSARAVRSNELELCYGR